MAVVHYKFKNSVEYDSLTFDGLAISLRDLKIGILKKKKMRAEDTDLQVVNAQTGEVYSSPSLMIPKNTSLIIARIPVGGVRKPEDLTPQTKAKKWAAFRKETQAAISAAETGGFNNDKLKQSSDLVNAQTSEIEKIAEMIKQSTKDFDPANYTYKFPTGVPNPSYICRRCGKGGHFIQNCTNEPVESSNSPSEYQRMKRPTGIPVDSMMFVDEPLPGTYKTHTGKYAVPKIDVVAYAEGKKERPPFLPELEKKPMLMKKPVPKELKCPLCGDLAKDAVVIPCCGISYCDECIRNKLLETEDHVCPSCDSMDVSPDGLIANQMLRRAVTNFQNETGYVKIAQRANAIKQAQAKAAEAAKAAAAATQILQKNVVIVPRGPSVLDYRPPATPTVVQSASAPVPSLSSSQRSSPVQEQMYKPASIEQEPPTPTLDEPARLLNHTQQHPISSATQNITMIEPVQTLLGQVLQPIRRPPISMPYDPYYKQPITNTSVPPPGMPPYPPPNVYPPPIVPPPFVPPPVVPVVLPPPVYPAPIPSLPAIPPPPVQLPKPLSKTEFLEEKNRLLREELEKKVAIDMNDPLLEFARKLEQRKERLFKSRSRSPRPRSRSLSRSRYRSRSRGKRSFSRSLTPRRSSLSPRRSYSPRRYSPRRSRSPRYSPRRFYSPRRSRSLSPRRYRSFSRSPQRRRSFSRSRSRDRRRSPFRRSYSRSPIGRRSPFRRSLSKGRYTPPRRSPLPFRRSSPRRSRSRGRSPAKQTYQRARSPMRYSPKRKRSPLRGSKEKLFSKAKSPKLHKDKPNRKKTVRGKDTKTKESKAKDSKSKDKLVKEGEPQPIETISNNTNTLVQPITNLAKSGNNLVQPIENISNGGNNLVQPIESIGVNTIKLVQTNEPNKENIPDNSEQARGNARSNNIVIVNIVDTTTGSSITTTDDNSEIEDKRSKNDTMNQNAMCNKVNVKPVKSTTELSKDNKALGDKEKAPASALGDKEKTSASALGDKEKTPAPKTEKDRNSNAIRKSKSRSRSKEKVLPSSRHGKQRKRKSPPKKRERSLSLSPERVKEPLKMPHFSSNRGRFDGGRDRNDAGRDRFEGGSRDRFDVGRGGFGRDWERSNNRDQDPYFRARLNVGGGFRVRDFRGRGRGGTDFRSGVGADYNRGQQQPSDFRAQEFCAPQQQQTDFRGQHPQTDFRGQQQQTDFRGQQQQTDFRGQQQSDFRSQQPPEFRGFPAAPPDTTAMANTYNRDYPQRGSPGYPANLSGNFPYPPPRDPREDPNWQGLVHDEDIEKFEQYKRFYDFYNSNRTYGFPPAPVSSTGPTGHTPPQGPPPAPPGTMPVPTPSEQGRRRSPSPRRHRSRSPGRRDKDRRDKERDYRDKRSPERRRDSRGDRDDRTPERIRNHSPEKKHTTDDSERDVTSPEKKSKVQDEKERKKEKRARKKKDKSESGEKKKKKRKDKSKTKKEKKGMKLKTTSSDNEEIVKKKSKIAESQNETESEKSDSDAENNLKSKKSRRDSTAQSESSDQESSAKVEPKRDTEKTVKNVVKDEDMKNNDPVSTDKPTVAETETEEKKPSPEKVISGEINSEQIKTEKLKSEPVSDSELAPNANQLAPEKEEKRRSIKRGNQDVAADEEGTYSKKVKMEAKVTEEQKMDTSGGTSPVGSEGFDDIPHLEDELMLDPPELSKWEKDDDPYDLSPEPTKVKEKWKPEKQTFLPRAVIEKAENVLAQKVMKPTTVSSSVSVIQPGKKDVKPEVREPEPAVKKREKSPIIEPKRRVFMEPDKKDERRVQPKQQHNVKITVTGDEKRKVATNIDLRNKLREKRYDGERDHSRDYDRSRDSVRDRDRDRSPLDRKRKDSYKDRRSSRDYDRQDRRGSNTNKSHGSGRSLPRKESVIDDSRFVPDYDDDSYSDDVNSENSSSESSSEEDLKRKHKHKRNKHKKEKKQKKKKEKKKKKHKCEKEKKVKSSVVR